MANQKKAKVALEGYKHECELIELVNNTAVILMDGRRTMTSIDSVTPVNAEAKRMLGVEDKPETPKKKEPLKKRPAAPKK